jgi:hypothetical protein
MRQILHFVKMLMLDLDLAFDKTMLNSGSE